MKMFKLFIVLAMVVMVASCGSYVRPHVSTPTGDLVITKLSDPVVADKITKIEDVIFFAYDSSLISKDEMVKVDVIASLAEQYPDTLLVVNGYASEEGATNYNLGLSLNRANAVKDALVAKGVAEDRINTVAKGETILFGELLDLNRRVIVFNVE